MIDSDGQVKLTGLRQVTHLNKDGEYLDSIFSLIGDNLEWASPEILAQVIFVALKVEYELYNFCRYI